MSQVAHLLGATKTVDEEPKIRAAVEAGQGTEVVLIKVERPPAQNTIALLRRIPGARPLPHIPNHITQPILRIARYLPANCPCPAFSTTKTTVTLHHCPAAICFRVSPRVNDVFPRRLCRILPLRFCGKTATNPAAVG